MSTIQALHEALLADDRVAIRAMLTANPALVDQVNDDGEAIKFLAVKECSLATLQNLIEYGPRMNLNDTDSKGRDFLHYAAMYGSTEKCRYLVEYGGMSPLRGDLQLETPFDIAHAQGFAELETYFADVIGATWENTYHNPIRRGFYPDPSVVRVGDMYYMVNSTFTFFPCIPISQSRDLVHWQTIGHAIEKAEWSHLEGLEAGRGWWAPDISYNNGRFYICATLRLNDREAVCRRQMVVTSDKPEGPYSEPAFIEEDGIDPSIFHDEDGRHYMLLNRGARIFELDESCTRKISDAKLIHYGNYGRAPEGPHLLKHNGWYYLFQAEGGTGMGHRETVSRSKTIYGPYTPSPYNPLVRQTDERALLQRCGHAKPFSTPDGRWFLCYLCGRAYDGKWTMMGRETALDPFVWTEDGWPLMNQGRGPSVQQVCPLPAAPMEECTDWLTPRPPKAGQIAWQKDALTIRGDSAPMSDTACRSIVLRRQTAFEFTFQTTMDIPQDDGECGIVCYYDERSFVRLGVRKDQLCLMSQIGQNHADKMLMVDGMEKMKSITLLCRTEGLKHSFSYVQGDKEYELASLDNVTWLSDEGVEGGKRFTGAMVGVFVIATTGVFREIAYKEGNI